MVYLQKQDKEVFDAIKLELGRQRANIELIASENFVSEQVMEAMGSVLTNKYAEGYPGKRYYGGCEFVDIVEDLARDRAKNYLALNMRMSNHTQVLKRIWQFIIQCLNQAILFLV